jgi:hypothetical protein
MSLIMAENSETTTDDWLVEGESKAESQNQFSLRSILWLMLAVGLYLGYASWLGPSEVVRAVVFALMSCGIGIALGLINRKLIDTLFWSTFVSMLAFLAVAGGRLTVDAVSYGWGVLGALVGGISVFDKPTALLVRMSLMSVVGGIAMYLMIQVLHGRFNELLWFDVGSAFVLGAMLAPFIGFLRWFENESKQPRILLAAWLTICVLIGNVLVPVLTGVSR